MPFVHVNNDGGTWFICDLPEGYTNTGYAYVDIPDDLYAEYMHIRLEASKWQGRLQSYATEGGKHRPFQRYFVNGEEQE